MNPDLAQFGTTLSFDLDHLDFADIQPGLGVYQLL